MLAFHPVKMNSCYEKVEHLSLEGLQQRFDVSSPSVFVQRAQILMREVSRRRRRRRRFSPQGNCSARSDSHIGYRLANRSRLKYQ